MLARLPRPFAILIVLLLAALGAWCATAHPPPVKIAKKGGYTDVHLYHDIVAAMRSGQPYHQAAAATQRLHNYPTHPFVTMRLPTLAEIDLYLGWHGAQILAIALAFVAVFLWVIATEHVLHWAERILLAVVVAWGAGMVTNEGLLALHEYWGGLFIAIALAGVVGWPRQWWWIVLPIACGLAIRELVLPFALLALVFALFSRRWSESAAWVAVIALFAGFMAVHAGLVDAQVHPGDRVSQGWHALQGFSGFLKAVIFTSTLQPLPLPLALTMAALPLFGWCALDGRAGAFCLALWVGFAVMLGVFSRADTFYWGGIMLPGYFAGFALVPRAAWQLAGAIRGRPIAVPQITWSGWPRR